jgi:hypothetical protein
MKEDGASFSEIQKQGNLEYQQLSEHERQEYEAVATDANKGFVPSSSSSLSQAKMIRRIIENINTNVSKIF